MLELGPGVPPRQVALLVEAELAYGEGCRRTYREYEALKIASDVPIAAEHFYDEFHAGRGPIASPMGSQEWFLLVPRASMHAYAAERARAWGVFVAGLAAMGMVLALYLEGNRTRHG